MSDQSFPETELTSAEEIVDGPAPSLRRVQFYKVSAERIESSAANEGHDRTADGPGDSDDAAQEVAIKLGLRTRQTGTSLGVRVELTAEHQEWRAFVDVSAEFVSDEPFVTTEDARTDFADKVGIMTLYPYIRETVGNLTQRTLDESYLLPTIQLGQISFTTKGKPTP